jgi:hypothetical protein
VKQLLRFLAPVGLLFRSLPVLAETPTQIIFNKACDTNPTALGCPGSGRTTVFGADSIFNNGIAVFIGVIASVSVIMVVIGGLRYVLSGGDSAGIKSAKDTILYALVGLAVSLVAFAIVSFVIGRIGS